MERILTEVTPQKIGQTVKLAGWVNARRDHGQIIFIDLRDRSGLVQLVFAPEDQALYQKANQLRSEWVILIEGEVRARPEKMINPKIVTGQVEVLVQKLAILAEAKTLPFDIKTDGYEINEEKRLKYRYLDLRRARLKRNLEMRQKVIKFMRDFLIEEDFLETETPVLTKSTPEGARDFLVPSRIAPGNFYALPQSPQQYKQLLQVAGVEKYFQVARVFRDEDPRADRQAEHTQLDIEMSFVSQEEILDLVERLYTSMVKSLFPKKKITQTPFIRMTYQEAMENYQSDKPDLRQNKNDPNELAFAFIVDFPMFEWHEELTSAKATAGKEKRLASRSSKSRGWWGAMHHPFTRPQTSDIGKIKKEPENILAHQYDFVLNGYEIGGGSLRTTDLEVLTAVFEVLGHKKQETKEQFSNYFEAFSYGVPPHGGIAPGIDRFLAVVLNEPNIREVIAFPKTGDNRDLMMEAPAPVEEEQLKELHLKVVK